MNTTTLLVPGGSKAVIEKGSNGLQDMAQVQAIIQKPVKYVENYYGQDIRFDPRKRNFDVEMSFWPKFGTDRMNVGALPYSTAPRLRRRPIERLMPIDTKTRFSRACWNECVNNAGPYYLRYWQIWDYAPFLPSRGDVSIDPRYTGLTTKTFTEPYRLSRGYFPKRTRDV